jgi:hypothetical protein
MNEEDLIIEKLILDGALEFGGIDATSGEILYTFTNKLKQIMPELYKEHLNFVNSEIMYFWEFGFVSIDDLADENPRVTLTLKAYDKDKIKELPADKQRSLEEIKRILKVV